MTYRSHCKTSGPTKGELLIEVLFSGANHFDITMVQLLGCRSQVLGNDFYGQGSDVTDTAFRPGDIVACYTIANSGRPIRYAQEHLPHADAAALTTIVQTANDALFNHGVVVIWGGATAVGIAAIQLARNSSTKSIIVTASPERHEFLKDMGATRYNKERVVQDITAAVHEAASGPVLGFDAAGTPDSAKHLSDALADKEVVSLASVYAWAGGRYEAFIGGRHYDVIFQPPGAPAPIVMPASPVEAAKMWGRLMWVVKHYRKESIIPATYVFQSTGQEALEEVKKFASTGRFGTIALKHPLA
ncbi:uncharacterized protein BDW43DRAFT_319422 [Aspergillus alliaceus]|uniref:uncharacterized protein n=1 Tax=Petromyces alliaceus TaxID=209559 RepID=UPI0012A52545|nr:uncharacterized protein BDW43DRAFT_319422 [Aspergillus alliaceus]KAB8239220.1 hypothetical protein BDW43DRAFT_319422 [Aspergillus alliaceus]